MKFPQAGKETASLLVKIGVITTLVREYCFDIAISTGSSMEPTLDQQGNAILIMKKWLCGSTSFQNGDIITTISPIEPNKVLCKRIAAKEGELVQRSSDDCLVIPKGHVWILGDNPGQSIDSRHYGPIPIGLIQGKVICKILPISKIGTRC